MLTFVCYNFFVNFAQRERERERERERDREAHRETDTESLKKKLFSVKEQRDIVTS